MAVENPLITQTVRVLVWESSVFAAEWGNSAQRESFLILNAGKKKQTLLSVVVVTTQLLAAAICKNVFFSVCSRSVLFFDEKHKPYFV